MLKCNQNFFPTSQNEVCIHIHTMQLAHVNLHVVWAHRNPNNFRSYLPPPTTARFWGSGVENDIHHRPPNMTPAREAKPHRITKTTGSGILWKLPGTLWSSLGSPGSLWAFSGAPQRLSGILWGLTLGSLGALCIFPWVLLGLSGALWEPSRTSLEFSGNLWRLHGIQENPRKLYNTIQVALQCIKDDGREAGDTIFLK